MCGIVGVIDQDNQAVAKVVAGLIALEYRGYDSWGIAANQSLQKPWVTKHLGSIHQRPKSIDTQKSHIALGHTRWATHGGITVANTHPHLDPTGRYAVVHNGVVENWQSLKASLYRITFQSETDTELIAYLFSTLPHKLDLAEKIKLVNSKLIGGNAFAVFDSYTNQLGAISSGSPLLIAEGDTALCLASDLSAFTGVVSRYRPLETGEIVISHNYQWITSIQNQTSWSKLTIAPADISHPAPGQMMLTELSEASLVIEQTLGLDYSNFRSAIQAAETIWLTGAGTAYHAALFGAHWLRQQHLKAFAFPSTESASFAPTVRSQDLLIAISQSGETRDTLLAVEQIKPVVGQTWSIINRPHSSLSRITDFALMTPAGTEYAVLATKSFIAQLVALHQLTLVSDSKIPSKIVKQIASLISQRHRKAYRLLAQQLAHTDWLAVIGEGSGWIAAEEAALKLKEGAYLPAEGLAGGELKHGTLALINPDRYCLALDVDPNYSQKLHNHLAEIKARGGYIIGISPISNSLFNDWISIPDLDCLTPIGGLIASQLLTYQTAIAKGINPDRPRNLAKSVTVI